jgi:protein-S-isoprenylcysteine O-methyltransferase Ste14
MKDIPPTYAYVCILANIVVFFLLPQFAVIDMPLILLGVPVITISLGIIIVTWRSFKKHGTPESFEKSKCVVSDGL